jgi:hypothetical protein
LHRGCGEEERLAIHNAISEHALPTTRPGAAHAARLQFALEEQGWWEEATRFSPTNDSRLAYRVEAVSVPQGSMSMVKTESGTIVKAVLPKQDVAKWARGPAVGICFVEPRGLKAAIEKDFRCLDPRRKEDESDNFDNPNASTAISHPACRAD